MRYTIILTIFIFLLAGCNKDKFSTVPQLKYEGTNTKRVERDEVLSMKLSFTDAEGDLTDSLYVEQFEPRCVQSRIKRLYKIPEFPTSKNQKGEILVTYANSDTRPEPPLRRPQCNRNDTVTFKFVLKDKAQNKSDTISSEPIIIVR